MAVHNFQESASWKNGNQRYMMMIADNEKNGGAPTPPVVHGTVCIKMFIDASLAAPPLPAKTSKANTNTAEPGSRSGRRLVKLQIDCFLPSLSANNDS